MYHYIYTSYKYKDGAEKQYKYSLGITIYRIKYYYKILL